MIDFVRGVILFRETDHIVVDVGGIGYRIYCANPYAFTELHKETTVYTHFHVREDAVSLFGFKDREEQSMFRKLIEVSGIGPRVAIGILSGARPQALAAAIQREDIAFLSKLPGIGKKTAQRLVLDLKDKLDAMPAETGNAAPAEEPSAPTGTGAAWQEAKEALAALGYSESEIDRALQAIRLSSDGKETVDLLIKRALKELFSA
jgi:Holliday junction DNA helicase RuvA